MFLFISLSLGRLAATTSADCSIKVSIFSMLQQQERRGEEEGSRGVGSFSYFVVWILCSPVPGQVLDVEHMISKTALDHQQDLHPVIRTLYDHADVRCLPTVYW